MELTAYLYTNPAGREKNEDSADYALTEDGGFFVLADGLGGYQNGAEASGLVTRTLLERWQETAPACGTAWLEEAVLDANGRLLRAREAGAGMGKSTVVALQISGERAAWVHVGDSRLYHLGADGTLLHVTPDHSVTYKKYLAGEIGRRQIRGDEDRPSLLRVLGGAGTVTPEPGAAPVRSGDAFLLCSDGLWEWLDDEEIAIDLLKAGSPRDWVERMLLRLLPRMSESADNLSALAVFAGAPEREGVMKP